MVDIASLLSGGKSSSKDYYWALVIEPGWVQAGVWEIEGEKAKIASLSPAAAWEVEEEIVGAADTALSAAIQNLPEDIKEPSKTVFGVPSSWVSDGQINSEHLEKIKRICSELSLEPTGFVVLPEAIAHLFKSEEGVPLNAVVVGVGDENIEIAVFKLGNLAGNSVVARSVSIADDVNEGLTRFSGAEAIPSRLLLYDGKEGELEEVKQSLLKVSWEDNEKVKFLHTPKIEIVEPDRKVLATALAGASEIANVSTIEVAIEKEIPPEVENVTEPDKEIKAQDLGFVVGEDVAKKAQEVPVATAPEYPPEAPPKTPRFGRFLPQSILAKFTGALSSFLTRPTTGGGAQAPSKRIFTIGAVTLGLLLIVGFFLWWYFPKAAVTIYVAPKRIDEKTSATFDANIQSPDIAKKTLVAKVVTTDTSGDKTKSTSGTKVVGEKAKGTVTLYRPGPEVTLASGTLIMVSNELKFTLDDSVVVASGSAITPGKVTANVTAADIGSQYNLASGSVFNVGNYPSGDLQAKNDAAFSGGTSRDISAVSQEDQDTLLEDLTNELLENAKEKLKEEEGDDTVFIPESVVSTVTSKTFSNKVGDEASTLKLSLEMEAKGITVDKESLYELAREALKEKTPSGFALRDEQLTFRFELVEESDGVYDMELTVGANLLPELKLDEIKKNISGRTPTVAENYLRSIPGFSRAEIKIKPALPGRLKVLPRMGKNIEITISAEK